MEFLILTQDEHGAWTDDGMDGPWTDLDACMEFATAEVGVPYKIVAVIATKQPGE